MLRRRTWLAVAVALLVAVPAATRSEGSTPHPPAAPSSGLTTDVAPVPVGSAVAPLASEAPVLLSFTLAFSNASRLASDLAAVIDPQSPRYRQFLTYSEFEREFGPSPSSVASVSRTLDADGATSVSVAPGGLAVEAVMTPTAADRLLDVQLVAVTPPGGATGFTAIGSPKLPAGLVGAVTGIDGLSDLDEGSPVARTETEQGEPAPVGTATSQFVQDGAFGGDWFIGTDYAQAYGATELLPGNADSVHGATYPTGVAVATLLASGYNLDTATALPPWDPSVVDAYFNQTFPAAWPHPTLTGVGVDVPGASAPLPPGSFHGVNDSLGFETENSLDLEMAGSLAPGASLYNFYFNGAVLVNPTVLAPVSEYLADDLGAALSYDDYGSAKLAAISCSFGVPDLVDANWNADLTMAAAMGVTVVAASGDQGDAPAAETGRNETAWPLWPSTAAYNTSGVVSVGGVSVGLVGSATAVYSPSKPLNATYDPTVSGFSSVTTWWDTEGGPGTYAGSEGGTSLTYAEPDWQFDSAAQWPIVNTTEREGFDQLGRAVPDVAFPANETIAFVSADSEGTPYFGVLGGTSIAAPVFAGMLADVFAVENATVPGFDGLGFLDPELYRIASYYWANPGGANDPFLPVVHGHNDLFSAAKGWNPTTGWGGIYAPLFLALDKNTTVLEYAYTGPTPSLPPPRASGLPWLEIGEIAAGAASVALLAAYLIGATRRHERRTVPMPPSAAPPVPPPAWGNLPPPTGAFATFSCPTCGADRPAEPGHCPYCGAM